MDLPSFNSRLNIEVFLDWIHTVENFFDYLNISEQNRVNLGIQIKGWSFCTVGTTSIKLSKTRKATCKNLAQYKTVTAKAISPSGLCAIFVPAISELSTKQPDSKLVHGGILFD